MAVNVASSELNLSVLIDFLLFGATLACVAIFHRHTLAVALIGLGAITIKKLLGDRLRRRRRASRPLRAFRP